MVFGDWTKFSPRNTVRRTSQGSIKPDGEKTPTGKNSLPQWKTSRINNLLPVETVQRSQNNPFARADTALNWISSHSHKRSVPFTNGIQRTAKWPLAKGPCNSVQ